MNVWAEPSSSLERLTGHWSPGAAGYQAWVTRTTDVAGAVMSVHVDPVIRGALGRGLGQTQRRSMAGVARQALSYDSIS